MFNLKAVAPMAAAVFIGICVLQAAQPARAYVLITDVDDTIKVSHVRDPINRVARFLSDAKAFSGMSTLYDRMVKCQENGDFAVISAAPKFLEWSVLSFLGQFDFPTPLYLQTRSLGLDSATYKTSAISEFLRDRSDSIVVLIGDDTEQDPEVYERVVQSAMAPAAHSAIYIRRVSNRPVGATVHLFDSAGDVAVLEYLSGRLQRDDVLAILSEVLTEPDAESLTVPGEYCPDEQSPRLSVDRVSAALDPQIKRGLIGVEDRLRDVCARLR